MRLTYELDKGSKEYDVHEDNVRYANSVIHAINKLGYYEDIEEELGIRFPVFVKIIKILSGIEDGIVFTKSEIDGEIEELNLVRPELNLKNQRLIEHYQGSRMPGETYYYFAEYGITWALTKEELSCYE